jgi:hypothetical protein
MKTRDRLVVLFLALALVLIAGQQALQQALAEPLAQGREFMGWILPSRLTVRGLSTFENAATFQGDVSVAGDQTITGDVTLSGNIANRSLFLRYQDVAAAPDIYAEAGVVSATTSITTSILGIETPRNAVVIWTTETTSTAGNITVAGIDARGNSTSELIAVGAVSGTQTLAGVAPWQKISSLALPTRTEAVTLTVKGGQRFGLPLLPAAAGDVYHLTVNATPQAAPTVNATYGTFDPVSTPAANVDYNVWVKQ